MWPNIFIILQQTISGEFVKFLLGTLCISYILYTAKVKIFLNYDNPQVTKVFNSQVGTSEAIRLLNIDRKLIYKIGKNNNSYSNLKFRQ